MAAVSVRQIPRIPAIRISRSNGPANLFHVYYTPLFAPWRWDRENLVPHNILYPKLMDHYQNMAQDRLRWQVIAHTAIREAPLTVMRERLRRRVREGFREGLKETGYDSNGRVLPSVPAQAKPLQDLRGTLEIHCRGRAGLDCEFTEIVTVAKSALSVVVKSFQQHSEKAKSLGAAEEWWKLDVRAPVWVQQRNAM